MQLNAFNNPPLEALMSVKGYYRWALLLPLLVPALASPLALLEPKGVLGAVWFFLFWSLVVGGVPYLLFVTGFLLWMRRVPDERVRMGILVSPLVYTGVLISCVTLFLLVDGALAGSSDSLGGFALFAVVIGYVYVALAEAGRALLRPAPAPAAPAPAL
jgi:hypothetical protein